ncbi:hypothetical protein H8N03_13965 [Ramlibacter sp. USB13]|uniref:Quinol:cytochrome C oxidoreductase n=1 Tax=Ramlibacter cellulosilyticus TaxID=2764187 RepID=A0A923MSN6_9BURK|nr:hypothetical protein [Ramlibacter cellulosilyticus]MBC5784053.1 hypothetical protein [Ramlibacter cellulosilyticus]
MTRLLLAAWLAAWWWCLGLVLGCFANAWTSRLSGGAWGVPVQASALLLRRALPWLLLAMLPLALGHAWLYPWASGDAWLAHYARPAFVRTWLSSPFWLARLAVYALAWWWITRPASLASKGRAAAALLLHVLLTSLASVDLLMALVPRWFSTAFGLVVLSVQALSGAAVVALLARAPGQRSAGGVPVSRDLGNLLLMWVMSWAYLAFMQFLIIWAENLPAEVTWYVPRLQTGWSAVGVALALLQLAVPFVLLLFRAVKDRPQRLRRVAALLLAASALDATWIVLPSVDPHTWHGWWLFPAVFLAAALLLWSVLRRHVAGMEATHAG